MVRRRIEIKVERTRAGTRTVTSPSGQPDPDTILKSLREDFALVDYAKFAEFIDASALERGRSFASLVGLSNYSRFRQALEGAADTRSLNTDFDIRAIETDIAGREREMSAASGRALAAYAEITGQIATDLKDVEGLCAAVSSALHGLEVLKSVVGTLDVRQVDLSAAEKLIEKEEGGAARKRQAELQQGIAELGRTRARGGRGGGARRTGAGRRRPGYSARESRHSGASGTVREGPRGGQ